MEGRTKTWGDLFTVQGGVGSCNYTGQGFFHSIGGYLAGFYSMNLLPNSLSISPQKDIEEHHFSYWSWDLGFLTNIHLSKYRGRKVWRPVVEVGVEYSLPLIFRYISRDLTGKYSERWIHKFNDFKLTGRIGFQNGISLVGSYRLFDIVNKNFPQLPKLQLGISIPMFGVNVSTGFDYS